MSDLAHTAPAARRSMLAEIERIAESITDREVRAATGAEVETLDDLYWSSDNNVKRTLTHFRIIRDER